MGFPMAQGGERDRPEGDGGMEEKRKKGWRTGLKAGQRHHYRGAIVLYLARPFLMRAPIGGGQVGTETGRWVVVVVVWGVD